MGKSIFGQYERQDKISNITHPLLSQNSTTRPVFLEPKLSSMRDDLCSWFLQLVLWKTCFYLQNECRARSSSFEILAFLMYHPGIFLSWLDRNLLSLEAKSDISIQCNKNIFWYLKFMDHPWLTRGTMDKTSPKSSFSVKQCQPLAARPFWDQLDGVHQRLSPNSGSRLGFRVWQLIMNSKSKCRSIPSIWMLWILCRSCAEFFGCMVNLSPSPTKTGSSFSVLWIHLKEPWLNIVTVDADSLLPQCSVNLRKSEYVWISDRVLTSVPIWDFQF